MPSPYASMRALGLAIEQNLKQHRWLLRYKHCQRVLHHWNTLHSAVESAAAPRRCLLDLRRIASDGEQGRRFHALVMLLRRGGYELSMVPRLRFLQSGHRSYKASALAAVRPYIAEEHPEDGSTFDLCLTDGNHPHPQARRTVRVCTDTRRAPEPGDLALPYTVFPAVWDQGQDAQFTHYRQSTRLWRLFFGGHCTEASYRRIKKYSRLNIVNRYQVVREINHYFAESTLTIDSHEQLDSARQQRHESFVMIDNARYRTAAEEWLPLLAQSDFFLAAPGCDYPLSHNAIEAIAVGTIPVLEYDSLFTPPLRDGVNCIAYRGLDGLRRAAARIDTMDQSEIAQLRDGAIEYYESHLSPNSFCQQLERDSTHRIQMFSYLAPAAAPQDSESTKRVA